MGSISVATSVSACSTNYTDFHSNSNNSESYKLTTPILKPSTRFLNKFKQIAGSKLGQIYHGHNISCDSFYGSQARYSQDFEDNNTELLSYLKKKHCSTLEMETYMLFHLAHICKGRHITPYAFHIVFANRISNEFIDIKSRDIIEPQCAKVLLDTIIDL